MGKVTFNPGKLKNNKVMLCQRCEKHKKLEADKYCVRCQIAVKNGESRSLG